MAGRDPVFNAADYMEVMQGPVAKALTGRDVSTFKANAGELDKMKVDGKRLHTALRYGITQALLHATALSLKQTMAEVIAREYGTTISKKPNASAAARPTSLVWQGRAMRGTRRSR